MMTQITNDQIRTLIDEADAAGDAATAAAGITALGLGSAYMPEHIRRSTDPAVQYWVSQAGRGDRDHARRCCADVIAEAAALRAED